MGHSGKGLSLSNLRLVGTRHDPPGTWADARVWAIALRSPPLTSCSLRFPWSSRFWWGYNLCSLGYNHNLQMHLAAFWNWFLRSRGATTCIALSSDPFCFREDKEHSELLPLTPPFSVYISNNLSKPKLTWWILLPNLSVRPWLWFGGFCVLDKDIQKYDCILLSSASLLLIFLFFPHHENLETAGSISP